MPGPPSPPSPAALLVLLSGGLDSLLAVRLLEREGARLECVHFVTGFNHPRYRAAVDRGRDAGGLPPVHIVDIRDAYRERVARGVAEHGRDPCVACRTLMLERAAVLARERGIEALATGEVVGQRVRGQCHADLRRIERDAGVAGRVLRPLSAAFLPGDALAAGGHVDPGLLARLRSVGRFQGRSRRRQLAWASRLGLAGHPVPSGGCCRLTDPRFVRRLADAFQHRAAPALGAGDLELLALGRHFRLSSRLKAVLGRDEGESAALLAAAGDRWTFQVDSGHGAVGLLLGETGGIGFEELGGLAARYSAERDAPRVRVAFRGPHQRRVVLSRPAEDAGLAALRI